MVNSRILVMLVPMAAYSPVAISGQPVATSKQYDRCLEKAGAVDPKIFDCVSAEHERQDKRLNAAYRNLLNKLQGKRKKELQDVQRQWIKYIAAHCKFYHDPEGGTVAPQMSLQCEIDSAAWRADELEQLNAPS